jgi:hypothetical protein
VKSKDPLAAGLVAAAVLGILAFAAAAVIILGMASPV